MSNVKDFLRRKDIVITPQRYLIEALGAMAQGLFASLLIGTIIKTLGQQTGLDVLVDLGSYATAMSGPAMAVAIGWALHRPPQRADRNVSALTCASAWVRAGVSPSSIPGA